MRPLLLVVPFIVAFPNSMDANVMTGNELQNYCSAPRDTQFDAACTQYVQGFLGGIEASSGGMSKDAKIWCIPDGATIGQARLVVEKYMREHPEGLHQPASLVTGLALMFAFPCKISN
jgi:hypothetical protein